MKQTLKQLRLLAAHMGITAHELHKRRAKRASLSLTTDDGVTLRYRTKTLCDPTLPDDWNLNFKTEYR